MRRELILSLRNGISDSACETRSKRFAGAARARARDADEREAHFFLLRLFLLAVPSRVSVAVDTVICHHSPVGERRRRLINDFFYVLME
jgi:hypothetical protein